MDGFIKHQRAGNRIPLPPLIPKIVKIHIKSVHLQPLFPYNYNQAWMSESQLYTGNMFSRLHIATLPSLKETFHKWGPKQPDLACFSAFVSPNYVCLGLWVLLVHWEIVYNSE